MSYIDYQAKLGWLICIWSWKLLLMRLYLWKYLLCDSCVIVMQNPSTSRLCAWSLSGNSLNSMTCKVMSQFGLESAVHDNGFTVSLNAMHKLIGFTSQFPSELNSRILHSSRSKKFHWISWKSLDKYVRGAKKKEKKKRWTSLVAMQSFWDVNWCSIH